MGQATVQSDGIASVRSVIVLSAEVAREITPLVVLLAMAWALGRRKREFVAFFLLGFGVWDIFYYVFLKVLLGWPPSLGTWDVLYLIPTAWVAPVWAPLMISATLILIGLGLLYLGGRHRRGRTSFPARLVVAVGTGLVLASFLLRTGEAFRNVPLQFDWPVFLVGWVMAVVGLLWWLWLTSRQRR